MSGASYRVKRTGKLSAIIFIIYGCIGLGFVLYQILSYKTGIRPMLDVVYPTCTPNNISGANFLAMFTTQSNIIVDSWLVAVGIAALRSEKAFRKVSNPIIHGAVTVYIFITGFIYCGILIWFQTFYPWDSNLWFLNIINFWQHMLTPTLMMVLWFFPLSARFINKKYIRHYLIFPISYFLFCIVRGAIMTEHFYPYPFLSAKQLWGYVAAAKEYNEVLAIFFIFVVIVIFCSMFYCAGIFLANIHNKRVRKRFDLK